MELVGENKRNVGEVCTFISTSHTPFGLLSDMTESERCEEPEWREFEMKEGDLNW